MPPQFSHTIKPIEKISYFLNGTYTFIEEIVPTRHVHKSLTKAPPQSNKILPVSATQTPYPRITSHTPSTALIYTHTDPGQFFTMDYNPPHLSSTPTAGDFSLHNLNICLNHSHSAVIHQILQNHRPPEANKFHQAKLTCTGFHIGNLPRSQHMRWQVSVQPGKVLCRYMVGPLHPPGVRGEKYFYPHRCRHPVLIHNHPTQKISGAPSH